LAQAVVYRGCTAMAA